MLDPIMTIIILNIVESICMGFKNRTFDHGYTDYLGHFCLIYQLFNKVKQQPCVGSNKGVSNNRKISCER